MKTAIIFPLALAFLVCEVVAQSGDDFKTAYLDPAPMTPDEVNAYASDPKNQLKPDPNPPKKGVKPPKSAGEPSKKIGSQIVGGSKATQGMFPWQIYLNAKASSTATSGWLCGGTIISTTAVLTAAHCVQGATYFSVTAGGVNRNTAETGEVTKIANSYVVHAGYNATTLVNDIAVLRFTNSPWVFSTYINAVRLPKLSQQTTTFNGSAAVASGYGKNATNGVSRIDMYYTTLTIIANAQCAAVYGSTTINAGSICTGYNNVTAVCSGDSGGPLVVKEADGKYTQVGVTSFVASTGCNGKPNGFVRVTAFLSWLNTNAGVAIAP